MSTIHRFLTQRGMDLTTHANARVETLRFDMGERVTSTFLIHVVYGVQSMIMTKAVKWKLLPGGACLACMGIDNLCCTLEKRCWQQRGTNMGKVLEGLESNCWNHKY